MKKFLPIIIALGFPLAFVLGILVYVSFFVPTLDLKHDFITAPQSQHSWVDSQRRSIEFFVRNGKLVVVYMGSEVEDLDFLSVSDRRELSNNVLILRYSVENDDFKKITLGEAMRLRLDGSKTSPDGFSFELREIRGNDISELFGVPNRSGYYVYKGKSSFKLDSKSKYYYYSCHNCKLLGWIID